MDPYLLTHLAAEMGTPAPIPSTDGPSSQIEGPPQTSLVDKLGSQHNTSANDEEGWRFIAAEIIDDTFAHRSIDLINEDLGGKVLAVSDQWFADARNLIKSAEVERRKGVFGERGAW